MVFIWLDISRRRPNNYGVCDCWTLQRDLAVMKEVSVLRAAGCTFSLVPHESEVVLYDAAAIACGDLETFTGYKHLFSMGRNYEMSISTAMRHPIHTGSGPAIRFFDFRLLHGWDFLFISNTWTITILCALFSIWFCFVFLFYFCSSTARMESRRKVNKYFLKGAFSVR